MLDYHQIQKHLPIAQRFAVGSAATALVMLSLSIYIQFQDLVLSDFVAILSTIVTTITTVVLAYLNWRTVKLTQQMAATMESSLEPYVDIELDMPSTELRFAFINSGGSAARNIQFVVSKDCVAIKPLRMKSVDGISAMYPIQNGISYLPSKQRLVYSAGRFELKDGEDASLSIIVCYSNDTGRAFKRTVHYDMSHINELLFESFRNNFVGLSKAIQDIDRSRAVRDSNPLQHMFQRPCSSCRQSIPGNAKKCHHCLEWVTIEGANDVGITPE